jgi:hypothetical protein
MVTALLSARADNANMHEMAIEKQKTEALFIIQSSFPPNALALPCRANDV